MKGKPLLTGPDAAAGERWGMEIGDGREFRENHFVFSFLTEVFSASLRPCI